MATIRDMMPAFELFQPADIEGALSLLDRYGENAWVLAGGLDSFDWLKERVKRPTAVVDLGGIPELRGVRVTPEGVEIGAMTTLDEVANHPELAERYGLLARSAGLVATPQIRHQGTLGGNVVQDTRCWYYRSGWPCYRAGGNICYAATPRSMNREHAIFGGDRCVAVSPTDTGPALIALEAKVVVRRGRSERVVEAEDFFLGPGVDITRMTILEPEDLLTAIRLPATWAGARFYFEKVRDRASWDFPLANVASAMVIRDGVIERARMAVGSVAPYPLRLRAVEQTIQGRPVSEDTATRAGEVAIRGAKPLRHNDFKVALVKNLVKRAVRGAIA